MSKIKEIIVEPDNVYVGSIFKLKIKAPKGLSYEDLKGRTYNDGHIRFRSYGRLKGE